MPIGRDTSSKSTRNDSEFCCDLCNWSHLLNPAELQLIITAIRSIGPELEVQEASRSHCSQADLSVIGVLWSFRKRIQLHIKQCCRLRWKGCSQVSPNFQFEATSSGLCHRPSYIPRLKQLVVTLPTNVHESILKSLHIMIDFITAPIIPRALLHVKITIHMNTSVDLPDDDSDTDGDIPTMGVPDMLIQVELSNLVPIPLWAFEVSQSQTAEAALWKLGCFARKSLDLEALTLIDIAENPQYRNPKDLWAIGNGLDTSEKTVSGFEEWADEVLVEDSSKVSMFSHTWMHPFKVTVTTWICSPDNILNIDNHDTNCYASEVSSDQLDRW